jgi:hypothetical protein
MNELLDQLQQATVKLSQGGPIKDRLADAYSEHLVNIEAVAVPERFRSQFTELHDALNREKPLPRESVVRASVRKMSNDDAGRYAALVVQVFATLARADKAATVRRKPRKLQSASLIKVSPIVKLFAVDG